MEAFGKDFAGPDEDFQIKTDSERQIFPFEK